MPIGTALLGAVLATVAATSATAASLTAPDERQPTRALASGPGPTRTGLWAWPLVPEPEVVRRFDPPDRPWLPGHRGVDLAAHVGQPVVTPTDGTVTWTGVVAGRGVVVVSHPQGLRSTFEPVDGAPPRGTRVGRGERVGAVTATPGHCAPKTCLHWGVRRGDLYLDPLSFVGRARIVLLPLP